MEAPALRSAGEPFGVGDRARAERSPPATSSRSPQSAARSDESHDGGVEISVIFPTLGGGELLMRALRTVGEQAVPRRFEIVCVDSGSAPEERSRIAALATRVERIDARDFDHGATRDLGARVARGQVLVFLNQDAVPVDETWLERLTSPFFGTDPPAAVQGGIREFPDEELARSGRGRFFWDSCGPRFYFTSESEEWIATHGGIGFSTVNCAIARWAWEEQPFGSIAILEDKRWQKRAVGRGWKIVDRPDAAVWHTHDYGTGSLLKRCAGEGFGWRLLGVRYSFSRAVRDSRNERTWRTWRRGLRARELSGPAELLFPLIRPFALWWGNNVARRLPR